MDSIDTAIEARKSSLYLTRGKDPKLKWLPCLEKEGWQSLRLTGWFVSFRVDSC